MPSYALSDSISIPKTESEAQATLEVQRLMNAASPADLEQANRRFHSVMAYLQGLPSGYQDINERTLSRWVKCISQYHGTFSGHSEKELLLATQELKRLGKLTRTSTSISAKRLAAFISQVQEHEVLLLQRLRDLEGHQVLNSLTQKPEQKAPSEMAIPIRANSVQGSTQPCLEQETLTPVKIEQIPIFGEIDISSGQLNQMIVEGKEKYHQEKQEILRVGLSVSSYINTDDRGTAEICTKWDIRVKKCKSLTKKRGLRVINHQLFP